MAPFVEMSWRRSSVPYVEPAGDRRTFDAGEMVYTGGPQDRRYKRDAGAWRGPAVVLMPDALLGNGYNLLGRSEQREGSP